MSITRRSNIFDPFDGFPFNQSLFSFARPSSSLSFPSDTSAFTTARVDWNETPEAHMFKADLPGIKKEEVKVEVEEGNVLQISGECTRENEDKTDTWLRVERSSGKFLSRFRLPENVKMDQIKAAMENGVLTVTVPKEEVKKPEVKSIDISGTPNAPTMPSIKRMETELAELKHEMALMEKRRSEMEMAMAGINAHIHISQTNLELNEVANRAQESSAIQIEDENIKEVHETAIAIISPKKILESEVNEVRGEFKGVASVNVQMVEIQQTKEGIEAARKKEARAKNVEGGLEGVDQVKVQLMEEIQPPKERKQIANLTISDEANIGLHVNQGVAEEARIYHEWSLFTLQGRRKGGYSRPWKNKRLRVLGLSVPKKENHAHESENEKAVTLSPKEVSASTEKNVAYDVAAIMQIVLNDIEAIQQRSRDGQNTNSSER